MAIYVYNAGNQTQGKQNQDFFLTRVARRTIDQSFSFAKFSSVREQMLPHYGNEFRTSVYYWSIFREVVDDNGNYTGVEGGYIAERDLAEVQDKLNSMVLTEEGVTDKSAIYQLGTFRKVTFSTTIKKLAGIVELTEDAETYSEDPVRVLAVEDATKQLMLTYNDLMMTDILSSSFVVYGGDATSRDELGGDDDSQAPSYSLSKKLLTILFGQLVKNKAKPMSRMIAGQNKIGTVPIPEAYYILVGADLYQALIDEDLFPDFIPVHKYPDQSNILRMDGLEEIGILGRFRFVYAETLGKYKAQGSKVGDGSAPSTTCHSSQDANGDWRYDVYPCIVFARDAIATVGLQGKVPHEMYVQFPEVIDGTNPIGERGYIAWKLRYASVITRPENLAVIEVVCPI